MFSFKFISLGSCYGQVSTVKSGRFGPAPGRFELSKGISKGKYTMALGSETLDLKFCELELITRTGRTGIDARRLDRAQLQEGVHREAVRAAPGRSWGAGLIEQTMYNIAQYVITTIECTIM